MRAPWRKSAVAEPVAASSEERSGAARRGSGLWLLLRRSHGRRRSAEHAEPPPTSGAGQATRKSDRRAEAGEPNSLRATAHANASEGVPGAAGEPQAHSMHYAATPPRKRSSPFASRRLKTPLAAASPLHPTPSLATPGMDPDQSAQGGGARKKTRRKKTSSQGDAPPPPPPSATIRRSTQSLVQHTPAEAYAALQLSVGRRAVPLPQSVREARGVVMAMESGDVRPPLCPRPRPPARPQARSTWWTWRGPRRSRRQVGRRGGGRAGHR